MMRVTAVAKEKVEQILGVLTDEEYKSQVAAVSIPSNAIDVHEMPEGWCFPADSDATFRRAWRKKGMTFSVDMPAARDIWRDKLRKVRQPLLEDLDIQFMRSLELGQDTKTITTQKQVLRDIPADPRIEAAQTPEDLKKITING
jgi:hypothetical protein